MGIEQEYYEHLIEPIEDQMIRSIWRIVRNPEDSEDTLQEALAVIWKRLERIRRHPNPHALILKICVDCAYDTLRRKLRRPALTEDSEALERIVDTDLHARDRLIEQEQELEIMSAIARLPRNQAVCILMRIVQERGYDEIAEALGGSMSTVRVHVGRGRARLRAVLPHLADEPSTERF